MSANQTFEIYLVAAPGLESVLLDEVRSLKFQNAKLTTGGVVFKGSWQHVWRANLEVRGAARVLARLGEFHVAHLAQLDKRARKFPWLETLRADVPVRVEVSCHKSKIYHSAAAAQRFEKAMSEECSIRIAEDAPIVIKTRIDNDLCTVSVDTSGDSLHKRGHKEAVGKAPMRENLAALFLRQCGFTGNEPLIDPMSGSGTFVIEAAEISAGLLPGRDRSFAFEQLATFDAGRWQALKTNAKIIEPSVRFYGSDRDAGVVKQAAGNAKRSGVGELVQFTRASIGDVVRPDGPPGLVICNPPYGARIGERKSLFGLYGALGQMLLTRFSGWRVGLITSDAGLAKASGLPFIATEPPVLHGGLRIKLHRTAPLP